MRHLLSRHIKRLHFRPGQLCKNMTFEMKPGAIISLISSNCFLQQFGGRKKKMLQFLLTGYFTTKISKEAAHASLLVHPWAPWVRAAPLSNVLSPSPALSRGWSRRPPDVPPNLYEQSLVDFQKLESICNDNKNKSKTRKSPFLVWKS